MHVIVAVMPTPVTPEIIVVTNYGAASDDKIGVMASSGFHDKYCCIDMIETIPFVDAWLCSSLFLWYFVTWVGT